MHDTVGIIYQFSCAETVDMEAGASASLLDRDRSDPWPSRKRKRFDGILRNVQPYFVKPKTSMELLPVDLFNNRIDVCKGVTKIAIKKDLLWIMSLS